MQGVDLVKTCTVVTLSEEVTVYNGIEELKETLFSLYQQGFSTMVLDFTYLTIIDASGLSVLLVFQSRLKAVGGELKIVNITSHYLRDLFQMINLHRVISIEDGPL